MITETMLDGFIEKKGNWNFEGILIQITKSDELKSPMRFYSKHHAAERWDLEFGSNTTEKFENSLKYFKTH